MTGSTLERLRESLGTLPPTARGADSFLVGLIGAGIQASRSPALHEREGAAHGLAYVYRLIDVDALGLDIATLPDLFASARQLGFTGLNITYPFKQAIIPLLNVLSPEARLLGAVNTVVFDANGRAIGHNTDWSGFAESFARDLGDVPRERVALVGAGGAGAAVGYALLASGVGELAVVDIDSARARTLAATLSARFGAGRAVAANVRAIDTAAGVVNATPVGMLKHPGQSIPRQSLRRGLWVADVVYFPLETELLRAARALGCRTMSGGGMAVFQAAEAFRLFTGRNADVTRMIAHFSSM